MTRVAAHIDVAVPAAVCIRALQGTVAEPRLLAAARALRPGREYSGWVTVLVPDRRVEITFAGFDPGTGKRAHALGWRVTYDFTPAPDGRTRVEVGVEYGWLAALAAAGTLRAQAENDVVHRLHALHALEVGALHGGAAGAAPAPDPMLAAGAAPPVAPARPRADPRRAR